MMMNRNRLILLIYSVFRFGEIPGNHKGLPLQDMYLTDVTQSDFIQT